MISFPARLVELADQDPDRPAVSCGDIVVTRSELVSAGRTLARELASLGVGHGDFVTIAVPNSVDWFISYVACWSLGAVPHPVSAKLPGRELAAIVELFPIFSRLKMMRSWGGIVDVCPDASPILSKTPVGGLYINCGWGTGGFKATPGSGWAFAYTIANDRAHAVNAPFTLDRFTSGALIDEHGAAAVAH